jgi:cobalt/nickel transport system permease protein
MAPLAVHISDGVLPPAWLGAGFALAAVLVAAGVWRLTDAEIPQLALLTAAFFVASLIHLPLGPLAPSSVHLLLNGLVGIILGRRSGLAVAVALFLQAALIGHGAFSTLGVNTCVMALPALAAAGLFASLRRIPALQRSWGRGLLVAGCVGVWAWSLLVGVELLLAGGHRPLDDLLTHPGGWWSLHPLTLAALAALGGAAARWERRLENAPDFPLGLLVGELTVLLTVALNALVLGAALPDGAESLAVLVFVAHLPLAALEGVVTGFTVSFLLRAAPHFLAGGPASPPVQREDLVKRHLPLPQSDADHG